MPRFRPRSYALIILTILAVPAAAQPVGVRWQSDIETAKQVARASNRLVLVHFWTETCGPCKMLEQNVFNQAGVGTAIESQFVPVKLNADQNSATAMGFGITRVPTDVVITPDGEVVGKLISPPTPSAYVAEVSQIASKYSTQLGRSFANAAGAAPSIPLNERVNSAYANLPVATGAMPAATAAEPTAPSTGASTVPGLYREQSPFGAPPLQVPGATPVASMKAAYAHLQPQAQTLPQQPQQQLPPQQPVNRYGASVTVAAVPPAATQPVSPPPIAAPSPAIVGNRYAAAAAAETAPATIAQPAQAPTQFANPYAGGPPQRSAPADQSPAATVPSAAESSENSPDPRRLPPGAPPLGFDGYCPVSMRNEWKWVPGDPQYGIIHRGRTYWFAGPEQQKQFWEDPDHYSPALSGLDPVLAIDHKQQVPGKREHSLDYDNLFYLFSSEATLQQFAANPERYATTVRQAMNIERGRMVR